MRLGVLTAIACLAATASVGHGNTCTGGQVAVTVVVSSADWATDIGWNLGSATFAPGSITSATSPGAMGGYLCKYDQSSYAAYSTYTYTCCMTVGSSNTLTCTDAYGDGWKDTSGGSRGSISVGGVLFCNSGGFDSLTNSITIGTDGTVSSSGSSGGSGSETQTLSPTRSSSSTATPSVSASATATVTPSPTSTTTPSASQSLTPTTSPPTSISPSPPASPSSSLTTFRRRLMNAAAIIKATEKLVLSRAGDGAVTCTPLDHSHNINTMKARIDQMQPELERCTVDGAELKELVKKQNDTMRQMNDTIMKLDKTNELLLQRDAAQDATIAELRAELSELRGMMTNLSQTVHELRQSVSPSLSATVSASSSFTPSPSTTLSESVSATMTDSLSPSSTASVSETPPAPGYCELLINENGVMVSQDSDCASSALYSCTNGPCHYVGTCVSEGLSAFHCACNSASDCAPRGRGDCFGGRCVCESDFTGAPGCNIRLSTMTQCCSTCCPPHTDSPAHITGGGVITGASGCYCWSQGTNPRTCDSSC